MSSNHMNWDKVRFNDKRGQKKYVASKRTKIHNSDVYKFEISSDKQTEYLKFLEEFLISKNVDVYTLWGKRGVFTGIQNNHMAHQRIYTIFKIIKRNNLYDDYLAYKIFHKF